MITKWEMTQVTENQICNQCVSVSYLVLCFVGWWCCFIRLLRRFVLLFISSPVCGQISRHKAAAKHHSDFEPSVFKQTRDFRHWLLLSGSTSLGDRTEIIRYRAMYFCSVVKRFYKRLLLVASSFQFLTTTKKNSRCRLPWSDDAIVGYQGMMRVMRYYLRGHLYYMPRIQSDHTRLEYIITWTHGSSKRDLKFNFPWASKTYIYIYLCN